MTNAVNFGALSEQDAKTFQKGLVAAKLLMLPSDSQKCFDLKTDISQFPLSTIISGIFQMPFASADQKLSELSNAFDEDLVGLQNKLPEISTVNFFQEFGSRNFFVNHPWDKIQKTTDPAKKYMYYVVNALRVRSQELAQLEMQHLQFSFDPFISHEANIKNSLIGLRVFYRGLFEKAFVTFNMANSCVTD